MPTTKGLLVMLSNQMMKGPRHGRYAEGSTPASRVLFCHKHQRLIKEIIPHLPRASAAVGAVVCKCAIRFGKEKAIKFATAVKDGDFKGQNDPAILFWHYLLRSRGKTTLEVYKFTVTACRAYCENRTLTHLRPAESDVFTWNSKWEAPNFANV